MKIAHIINPVVVSPTSDLHVAQPVTFRCMFAAKRYCFEDIDVELQAIGYPEDAPLTPARFTQLPFLTRSVLDLGRFQKQRKLPLIKDIIDTAVAHSDADYFIYSNVDISPMPYFYSAIADLLKQHDALVINRRTIDKCDDGRQPLSVYYQQAGESHPGFDCFVFKREQYQQYKLYDACIGANWIGRVLICNLLAYSENPKIVTDAHLTFHLGDDRSWKTTDNIDFDQHNETQVGRLMGQLKNECRIEKHDLLHRSYEEFYLKTSDPDVTRPKSNTTPSTVVDLGCLPQTYLPSKTWHTVSQPVLRQDPVFIIGHPRSGTTLLQSLVATQLTERVFPETHFFSIVRSFIKVIDDRIQSNGLDRALSFIQEKLATSPSFETHVTKLVTENQLSPKMLFEAIVFDQLAQHLSIDAIEQMTWMEKTPDHAEHLDVIHRFYPNSKFIFIIRDPEKAILSRRKHFTWNRESEWPIQQHAERWLKTIQAADAFRATHGQQIHYVRFEDLVRQPESELAAICEFLKIDFNPTRIAEQQKFSQQQSLPWETWKSDTQATISQKIAAGVDESLTVKEKAMLDEMLRPYLNRYGYVQRAVAEC